MNSIKPGETYLALRHRVGEEWELLSVRDENGHFEITLYVTNRPCGVLEGQSFRVAEISGVSYGSRKNQSGEWLPCVRVFARVEPAPAVSPVPAEGKASPAVQAPASVPA